MVGRYASQGTQHEVTGNIATPPGWDASPSKGKKHEATGNIAAPPLDGMLVYLQGTQHEVTGNIATPPGWEASRLQVYLSQVISLAYT